jgi:hypothetical protein
MVIDFPRYQTGTSGTPGLTPRFLRIAPPVADGATRSRPQRYRGAKGCACCAQAPLPSWNGMRMSPSRNRRAALGLILATSASADLAQPDQITLGDGIVAAVVVVTVGDSRSGIIVLRYDRRVAINAGVCCGRVAWFSSAQPLYRRSLPLPCI